MLNQKLMGKTGEDKQFIEDLFAVHLYTGNGSTQTITNGIDLAGKGGMVWFKNRNSTDVHVLLDSARGPVNSISTNTANIQNYDFYASGTTFNSNGITLNYHNPYNANGQTCVSWTFRKAPKFFDVVTYTGNGVDGRAINHSLGQAPGMILIKSTSQSGSYWFVWHRSAGGDGVTTTNFGYLNDTRAFVTTSALMPSAPTSTYFTISNSEGFAPTFSIPGPNTNGATYVAYLFAHDTTTDGLIQCGSFTNSTTDINLGWEPQYVLTKKVSGTIGSYTDWWTVHDNMRGMSESGGGVLWPHLSDAESSQASSLKATATGFNTNGYFSYSSGTYIYMAIRRGPMRTPTDGGDVFQPDTQGIGATYAYSIQNPTTSKRYPFDMMFYMSRSSGDSRLISRLQGDKRRLAVNQITAETVDASYPLWSYYTPTNYPGSVTVGGDGTQYAIYRFRRAPGFFDVVCYTGTGTSGLNQPHGLGVRPELIIYKHRTTDGGDGWLVSYAPNQSTTGWARLKLHTTDGDTAWSALGNAYNTTSTTLWTENFANIGTAYTGATHIALLFASCPGVSKIGTYTGNNTSQNIDCGFTNGARFVLIKRTSGTGGWFIWDTARGIIAGNDPYLTINSLDTEVTSTDLIDPYSAGFTVSTGTSQLNGTGSTYLYLAIA